MFPHDLHVITEDGFSSMRESFMKDPINRVAMHACTKMDPLEVCTTGSGVQAVSHVFTHKVDEGKPVSNQKSSGRCWIFALFNTIRVPFMKRYNLDEFEFSQGYLFFCDKVERCNFFLNNMIEMHYREQNVESRLFSYLLNDPISDGGQWDMLVNLVMKYGMMPKKNFQESYSSESTARMNAILRSKLREFSKDIHDEIAAKGVEKIDLLINTQLSQLYKIIAICLGVPGKEFTWEYYDKNKEYQKVGPITPQDFYTEYVKPIFDIENKVCLVNDPRLNNPYGQAYTVDLLGNMVKGRKAIYNNQPIELLMKLASESIKNGEPVWFGCEVSKRFASKLGVEDLQIHDYDSVFGSDIGLNMLKGDRLSYGESAMSHAMVLTGVSFNDDDLPAKWRVENSWGDDRGEKGYLMMTSAWFREFVFEVVVDKSLVPHDVMEIFSMVPTTLPAWDPMGTLACKNCGNDCCSDH